MNKGRRKALRRGAWCVVGLAWLLVGFAEIYPAAAGDFNFTEASWEAGALTALGFRDAFDASGRGRGASWPVIGGTLLWPGLRLDHVYLRGLASDSCWIAEQTGSDHLPVVARVGLRAP